MVDTEKLISNLVTLSETEKPIGSVQRILLPEIVAAQITAIVSRMPAVDRSKVELTAAVQSYLLTSWRKSHPEFTKFLFHLSDKNKQDGFFVLNVNSLKTSKANFDLDRIFDALLLVLSPFGIPFGAYTTGSKSGLWHTHGVIPSKPQFRAESLGYIPFHMDMDAVKYPPDGSILFCEIPDQGGGGANLIANYRKILSELSEYDRQVLRQIYFRGPEIYDVHGVGETYNPHVLLDAEVEQSFFRYNGKVLPALNGSAAQLFHAIELLLHARAQRFLLGSGDMLFMDQHRILHAREALNLTSEFVPNPATDRKLWQIYTRAPTP